VVLEVGLFIVPVLDIDYQPALTVRDYDLVSLVYCYRHRSSELAHLLQYVFSSVVDFLDGIGIAVHGIVGRL